MASDALDDDEWDEQQPDLGGGEWDDEGELVEVANSEQVDDEDEAADEDDDVDEADDDENTVIARTRMLVDRRAAEITAKAALEAVDTDWAPAVEVDIAEGIAAHGPPGTKLVSARCRTTVCITEIELPPDSGSAMQMSWLAAAGLRRGFLVHGRGESGAGDRTVAYLAREGYSLP
ncbi:hypothetical protein DB30_03163 [Enhygromyxa salina]|uniref:Uncharacterized protein n=1 Tax=Enhygromyxa salina TaxID=215803 RepID=A0A0C2DCL7_9BACT|nr:hypothetical protein [Enhygromyxa salina]KIG17462.1 hypothetical protein DB30_03163 [Enhygromyxa salina]